MDHPSPSARRVAPKSLTLTLMEQVVFDILTILVICFGFYVVAYGVGIARAHPATIVGRAIAALVKPPFVIVAAVIRSLFRVGSPGRHRR